LYLIGPLFTIYELNPVALTAQASVPVPEGLDLDAWIVPPPKDVVANGWADDGDEAGRRQTKKSKKGKGKEVNGAKAKSTKKKLKAEGDGVVLTPAEPDVETVDERAERERVCPRTIEIILIYFADLYFSNSGKQNGKSGCETTHTTLSTIGLQNRQLMTWIQFQL